MVVMEEEKQKLQRANAQEMEEVKRRVRVEEEERNKARDELAI